MSDLPLHQHHTIEGAVDCHVSDCDVYVIQRAQRRKRQQHLSECFLAMFPREPTAHCTCDDWSPDA